MGSGDRSWFSLRHVAFELPSIHSSGNVKGAVDCLYLGLREARAEMMHLELLCGWKLKAWPRVRLPKESV